MPVTVKKMLQILQKHYSNITTLQQWQAPMIENQLGVRFSEDYRAYLLNYGEVSFGSHELTGICRSERINVVNVTEEAKKPYGSLLSDCYVIEDTYFDDIYIL